MCGINFSDGFNSSGKYCEAIHPHLIVSFATYHLNVKCHAAAVARAMHDLSLFLTATRAYVLIIIYSALTSMSERLDKSRFA